MSLVAADTLVPPAVPLHLMSDAAFAEALSDSLATALALATLEAEVAALLVSTKAPKRAVKRARTTEKRDLPLAA